MEITYIFDKETSTKLADFVGIYKDKYVSEFLKEHNMSIDDVIIYTEDK